MPLTGVRAWSSAQISELPIEEMVEQWARALATPVSLVILGAGFFGLFVGWLMGRGRRHESADSDSTTGTAERELLWRHEKLVLWERQEEEKRTRFDRMFAKLGDRRFRGILRSNSVCSAWPRRCGTGGSG